MMTDREFWESQLEDAQLLRNIALERLDDAENEVVVCFENLKRLDEEDMA